jgi:hypothetical protein
MATNSSFREIQDNVLSLLNKSQDTSARTRVKNWINLGQSDFVLRELWPFRETAGSLSTVAGTQEYDIVTNFPTMDASNILSVAIQGANETKLKFKSFNQIQYISPDLTNDGNALPVYYYIRAGKIGFFPVPAGAYTVSITYYAIPTELSADADTSIIPVNYREALLQYGLSMEHDFDTDPDLAQKAMNRYEQIVNNARQNLLNQPSDDGVFTLIGPESYVNHTGLTGETL